MEIPPSEFEFAILIGGKYRFQPMSTGCIKLLFSLLHATFKYSPYVFFRVKYKSGSKNGLHLVKVWKARKLIQGHTIKRVRAYILVFSSHLSPVSLLSLVLPSTFLTLILSSINILPFNIFEGRKIIKILEALLFFQNIV